ncbi:DUF362 domain-containing protein [Candidatus Sumerlaeota bacterium]|nr:DUF362 domain-containing protein [Candidatus Sumerlaeota bacterium]
MPKPGDVAVYMDKTVSYGVRAPFHPPAGFPEYRLGSIKDESNTAYAAVRTCLRLMGLDRENYGTPAWNPLRGIVQPGETVVIKPNMIAHKPVNSDSYECLITDGSVIRAVVDYVYLAMGGEGTIVVADAPQEDSHIELIKQRIGIDAIREFYSQARRFEIKFCDLRDTHRVEKDGVYVDVIDLPGDPLGNVRVDLGRLSYLAEHDGQGKTYYGSYYDIDETNTHHSGGLHEYMLSRTALEADVFIGVPKLKTHKKVGVTLNLKGLVGINGRKNWLPHYAIGSPSENGDQFPEQTARSRVENSLVLRVKSLLLRKNPLAQLAARKLKPMGYKVFGDTEEVVRSGNWYGNDTCWRMSLDLNRALLYANAKGLLGEKRKRFFSIVDGIVGMEGNGPVAGRPRRAGLVIAGVDPVAVDAVGAALMGFDYRRIPLLARAFDSGEFPLAGCRPEDIVLAANREDLSGPLSRLLLKPPMAFEPHFGWKGQVEIAR